MILPLVSICIPAYRSGEYIPETLSAVARQRFAAWEIIVTEDGSRDGTDELVRIFARNQPQRVIYQRHTRNRGLPATRNSGIESARAGWIALLDADDLWREDHLETLVETAQRTRSDLVHAGSRLFDDASERPAGFRVPTAAQCACFPQSLFGGDYVIQTSSVLLRRSLWQRVGGFDGNFRFAEDRDMWLRCARAGARISYSGQITCYCRDHEFAMSRNTERTAEAAARALHKHLDWDAIPARVRRSTAGKAWITAGRASLRENPQRARRHFAKAWRASRRFTRPAAYWLFASWLAFRRPAPDNPLLQ